MNSYHIGEKMDFYNFRCAFEVVDDRAYSIMIIHPTERLEEADVYSINKHTGAIDYRNYELLYSDCMFFRTFFFFIFHLMRLICLVHLFVPHDDSDDTDQYLLQIDECVDKKNKIPKNLPISVDITKRNHHIEIVAYHQNKYDFYKINWEGVYCFRAIGEHQMPNSSMEGDNKRCDK